MSATATVESLTLHINRTVEIAAPTKIAFDAILEQMGPSMITGNGAPQPLKIEAWPGGRWFRDLGNNTGHFWGHVQVIKPPTLLELCGPMFMSYAAINFVQFRLTEQSPKSTLLTFTHKALGDLLPDHREGVHKGWEFILNAIKDRAQR